MADDNGDQIGPKVEIEGLDEAIGKLAALGDSGQAAFEKIANSAAKVETASAGVEKITSMGVEGFAHLASAGAEAFSQILDAAARGDFAPLVTKMFGEAAGAIAKTTEEVIEFIHAQAEVMETLSNLAMATGMSTSEILGMREAFASVGISTNGFERSIGRLAITIANEWGQIQHAVRTSADEQSSAMLHVQETAFGVEKAYTAMNSALTSAAQSSKHDALAIEESALSLQRAVAALSSASLEARSSALGVESAKLALIRAQMNLAKDQGKQVNPADEKALKIEQDKLAVKDAQLRIEEAQKKQAEGGLELQAKQLAVKKAQMEIADAAQKQADDAVKNAEKIRDAELNIQKARLASREAQEKSHELDLKNIPAIAQQIDQVIAKQREWTEVTNRTELSAQSLTKAVILAAAGGSQEQPTTMAVFKEMSLLFARMGDDATAANAKLEIIQHTMGAGFRAGQASVAQVNALMARGFETLQKFNDEMASFGKSIGLHEAEEQLKDFNVALSRMEGAWDVVKSKMAGVMSVPLTAFFEEVRESIMQPTGALNRLASGVAEVVKVVFEMFGKLGSGLAGIFGPMLAEASPAFSALGNLIVRVMSLVGDLLKSIGLLGSAFGQMSGIGKTAWSSVALAIDLVSLSIDGLKGTIGAVVIALGELYAFYLRVTGQAKTMEEASKNALVEAGKAILKSAIKDTGKDLARTGNDLHDAAMGGSGGDKMDKAAEDTKAAAGDLRSAGAKHSDAAETLKQAGSLLGQNTMPLTEAGTKLADAGASMAGNVSGAASDLRGAAAALSAAAQAITAASKPVGAKAGGGKISGPGGPRDDGAGLFALSDGEFVVQSSAVQHYGAPLFEALNSLAVGGFATGGAVGGGVRAAGIPAGAGAGPSSVLNLTIDGQTFGGLRAPENVASKLKTFAVTRQTSSTGNKPSWMG